MNNKGFAVTSMVYAIIILLTVIMFTSLAIERAEYGNQKDFVNEIEKNITECFAKGEC